MFGLFDNHDISTNIYTNLGIMSLPAVTYSKTASMNIEQWQKQLMDTQLMQKD